MYIRGIYHMQLAHYIAPLLREHDCVILPGFGAFLAHYEAARMDEKRHLFFPPSKRLSFNREVNKNDGLLISTVVVERGMLYPEALQWVSTAIIGWQRELNEGRKLSFPGIGEIIPSAMGRLEFFPENEVNYLADSFGLNLVRLPAADAGQTVIKTVTPAVLKPSWKRLAVAAMTIPLVAASLYIGMEKPDKLVQLSHFWSAKTKQATFQPRFEEEFLRFDYGQSNSGFEELFQAAESAAENTLQYSFVNDTLSDSGITVRVTEPETLSELDLYFIVGGAFREKVNAEHLVKTLQAKGYDAHIFAKSGDLHLVCYGSYSKQDAARAALTQIQSAENSHAWMKHN